MERTFLPWELETFCVQISYKIDFILDFLFFVGWDQTEKTIKIYISLKGVENVPRESIKLESKQDSFDLLICNLDGKNHNLNIKNLLEPVDPAGSSYKVCMFIVLTISVVKP